MALPTLCGCWEMETQIFLEKISNHSLGVVKKQSWTDTNISGKCLLTRSVEISSTSLSIFVRIPTVHSAVLYVHYSIQKAVFT